MFNKNFIILLFGQAITMFGSNILRFALALYVLNTTGRSDFFALLLAVSTIPFIIITPLAGVLVDRLNKKILMVTIDFVSALIVGLFLLIIQNSVPSLFIIGLVMVLTSVVSAAEQPNSQAILPLVINEDNIVKGSGMISSIAALSGLMAPLLGGVLYSFFGLMALVIVTFISFVIAVLIELFIKIPKLQYSDTFTLRDLKNDFKDGVNYVTKENRFIYKVITLAALLNLFLTPLIIVAIPYLIKVVAKASNAQYGIAQTIIEISMLLGAILVSILASKLKINRLYRYLLYSTIAFIPIIIATLPMVLSSCNFISYLLLVTGTAIMSVIFAMISAFVIGIIQRDTPKQLLGKIMGLVAMVSQCATPIGQIIYGIVLELFKNSAYISVLFIAIALIVIVMALKAKNDFKNY